MHDVYVFGDSHWRVFFPFVNHESPGVTYEEDGIRVIDMVANELSGATMYGLLNSYSKNGARRRILGDLDETGPVKNVALVFGEVDVRYHNDRYYRSDGSIDMSAVDDLIDRFSKFIREDLIESGRVTDNVFFYYGYAYPNGTQTLLQPGIPIRQRYYHAIFLHDAIANRISERAEGSDLPLHLAIHRPTAEMVSSDGVHLHPTKVFPITHRLMREVLLK